MKNKFLIIMGSIIIILVAVIIIFGDHDNNEYLTEINYNTLVKKIDNNEDFILYIKQTDCQHCMKFTPVFEKVLKNYKIKAYYLNLTNLESENRSKLYSIVKVDGTPVVYFFENGKAISTTIDGNKSKDVIIGKLKATGYIE